MRFPLLLAGVSTFVVLVWTDTLDLGDLNHFVPKLANPPTVEDGYIWVSRAEGGYSVVPAKGLREGIGSALQGCPEKNDKCFQELYKTLGPARIQIDPGLDKRVVVVTMFAIAEAISFIIDALTVAAFAVGADKLSTAITGDKGAHLSDEFMDNLAKVPPGKEVTAVVSGTPLMTVTRPPRPTPTQGGATPPMITEMATPSGAFQQGDLVLHLDPAFATRLQDYAHVHRECEAGAAFDKENPSRKRALGSGGNAICGFGQVILGAGEAGPLQGGMRGGNLDAPGRRPPNLGPDVVRAMNVIINYVNTWAPATGIQRAALLAIVSAFFPMVYYHFVYGQNLGGANKLDSDPNRRPSPISTTSSTTSSRCPEPTKIACGTADEDCPVKFEDAGEGIQKAVCETDGKNGEKIADCPCAAQAISYVDIVEGERLQSILAGGRLTPPDCPVDFSDFPANLFSSQATNVYSNFCKMWNQGQNLYWKVNAKGEQLHGRRHLAGRTPPPNPNRYDNYDIALGYVPAAGKTTCKLSCQDAFTKLAGGCATNAGPGVNMYKKGNIAAGCGKFAFEVIKTGEPAPAPPRPPVPKTNPHEEKGGCFKQAETQGSAANVQKFNDLTHGFCDDPHAHWQIKQAERETFWMMSAEEEGVPYRWRVFWLEHCYLEGGATEKRLGNPEEIPPLPGFDEAGWRKVQCQNIFRGLFDECQKNDDNGRVGGYRQIGCLVYEFKTARRTERWSVVGGPELF